MLDITLQYIAASFTEWTNSSQEYSCKDFLYHFRGLKHDSVKVNILSIFGQNLRLVPKCAEKSAIKSSQQSYFLLQKFCLTLYSVWCLLKGLIYLKETCSFQP